MKAIREDIKVGTIFAEDNFDYKIQIIRLTGRKK